MQRGSGLALPLNPGPPPQGHATEQFLVPRVLGFRSSGFLWRCSAPRFTTVTTNFFSKAKVLVQVDLWHKPTRTELRVPPNRRMRSTRATNRKVAATLRESYGLVPETKTGNLHRFTAVGRYGPQLNDPAIVAHQKSDAQSTRATAQPVAWALDTRELSVCGESEPPLNTPVPRSCTAGVVMSVFDRFGPMPMKDVGCA